MTLGNIYVSPYGMDINGSEFAAMCIDYPDDSSLNTPWQAYITPLAGGNFANTYHHSDKNVAVEYKEEAYLYSQITKPGITDQTRIDIQEAVWEITDAFYHPTSDATHVANWLLSAQNDYASVNLGAYEIVSDVDQGKGRNQEFLIATPEPSTLTLLGAGLLLATVGAFRKRFAKATAK